MNVVPKDHNYHHSSASAPGCGCALESLKIPITGSLSSLGFSTHPVFIFITHPNSFVPCGVHNPATLHFSLPSLVFLYCPWSISTILPWHGLNFLALLLFFASETLTLVKPNQYSCFLPLYLSSWAWLKRRHVNCAQSSSRPKSLNALSTRGAGSFC